METKSRRVAASLFLALAGPWSGLSAQEESAWIARLGGSGTGTSDEGIIRFLPATGLGEGSFGFSNSWGVAASIERVWRDRWHFGIHASYAPTDLSVTAGTSDGTPLRSEDRSTFAPVLLEAKYGILPHRAVNPLLGLTGGVLFARDASLSVGDGQASEFRFDDGVAYGYLIGADVSLRGGWQLDLTVRSLAFEYSLERNELVPAQTLQDQDALSALNHLVLTIGRRW